MKYFGLFLAAIVIYLIAYFIRFEVILAKANLPAVKNIETMLGTGDSLRYIAAGDSTALGQGASDEKHNYTYQVAEHLAVNHKVIYKNIGVSGERLAGFISDQLPQIIEFNPDVVTISISANDITHWQNIGYIENNLEKIITELIIKTHAQIYLAQEPSFTSADLLPFFYRRALNARSIIVNHHLASWQKDKVKIAPVYDEWIKNAHNSSNYAADHFHPNDLGYEIWSRAFLQVIK
jgi:lysophospholipase L1-like esterase